MSPDDRPGDDDRFADLLAHYSEALAVGRHADLAQDPSVPSHLLTRLRYALDGLHRLRRARPLAEEVPTMSSIEGPATLAPEGEDTLGEGVALCSVGRFRILRRLGGGGGGIVFLAFDPEQRREVALKVPRLAALLRPELRRRFLIEAKVAEGLDHPNLVPIHETGEADGVCFIVSAYCPGGSLAEWLVRQSAPVSPRLAAGLVAALADALHHVHRRGICHCDVKPGNVLLDPTLAGPAGDFPFTPRLTDFGLATLLDGERTAPCRGAILGTPPYMAPEQVEGRLRDIGPPTDVYGLGAVLYELLTGQPPFRDETNAATLRQVLTDEPAPLRRLRRDVPPELETICLKCLQKKTTRRYATAAELADDLRR